MDASDTKHIVLTKIASGFATFKIPTLTHKSGEKWVFRVRLDYVNAVLLTDEKTIAHYVKKSTKSDSISTGANIAITRRCWSRKDIKDNSDIDMKPASAGIFETYNVDLKNSSISSPLLCEALGTFTFSSGLYALGVTGDHLTAPYRVLCDLASESCFVATDDAVSSEYISHIFFPSNADGKILAEVGEWKDVDVKCMKDGLDKVDMRVLSANDSLVTFYPRTTYTI